MPCNYLIFLSFIKHEKSSLCEYGVKVERIWKPCVFGS